MKSSLSSNLLCLILFTFPSISVFAQNEKLPTIKSNSETISIQEGENLQKDAWRLSPDIKPDVYEADLIDGKPHQVSFITDVDRISFTVEENKKYDFIIEWNGKNCYTQIVGNRFIPAARFDKKYQAKYKDKITVEIPEVYELVNIALAMTPTSRASKDLAYQNSDYYKKMRQWFDNFQNHQLLADLDADLKSNSSRYFYLKMDGYAFEFDRKGKIVQNPVYDRASWSKTNTLRPYLTQLQSFADETNFRTFFKRNKQTYNEQIDFYRNIADVGEMKGWLDKNFPTSNNYDHYKIIFSPLVSYNQSTNWFESNNFKELQPHVNFPYPEDFKELSEKHKISSKSQTVFRGDIVFTEINHGYINPEAEKYVERISKAISNTDFWVTKEMGKNYGGNALFNEYMNWGLVCLRFVDYVPRNEQDRLFSIIDEKMTKRRGFLRFAEFDEFLVDLYRNRKPNQTVADLYPQIIEWFEKNN